MSSICSVMTDKPLVQNIKFNKIEASESTKTFHCINNSFLFNGNKVILEKISVDGAEVFSGDECEILFYGSLYNVAEIKSELIENGCHFKTEQIEEVIASSYKKWGEKCVEKFNGAFCFVLFDKITGCIMFARDRLGKKNLYYYYENGDLVISTELKAFFKCDFIKTELNKEVMGRYIRYGFVPCPDSILKNVYKLAPGSYATLKNDVLTLNCYWSPLSAYKANRKNKITDYNDAKAQLDELLKTCVKDRLSAEKDFGVFLSSGIDSSLMAAITQSVCDEKINTYTIGVDNLQFNEALIAKKISEHIGTIHHEHYISEDEMVSLIADIPLYYDEPFGDTSLVPSMVLMAFVKDKLDIAIGGDGGDEVFCGYPHYKLISTAQKWDFLGGVLNRVLPAKIKKKLPSSIRRVMGNRNKNIKCQLVMPEDTLVYEQMLKYPAKKTYFEVEQQMDIPDWQIRRMVLDMQTSLPGMIYKVEKAALSSELDVRAPILDYRLIEFSFRLPQKFKFNKDKTKFILRDIATDYIPEEILNSPKRGFNVPVEEWMRNNLKDMILKYSEKEFLEEQDIFNYESINSMVESMFKGNKKISTMCWNYLMFQLWYDKYMRS